VNQGLPVPLSFLEILFLLKGMVNKLFKLAHLHFLKNFCGRGMKIFFSGKFSYNAPRV
jgi:hypothetical protein